MTILQVGADSLLSLFVTSIVGVIDGEFLEHPELGFDQVEPTGLGGGPDRVDVQFLEQREKPWVVVDLVEIVEDNEQWATWVAFAEAPEGITHLGQTTAWLEDSVEVIGMHVVERQEMLDAVWAAVGGSHTDRAVLSCPCHAAHRSDLQRAPLVETQHNRSRGTSSVELPDQFFLLSKCGSEEVFQVRIR